MTIVISVLDRRLRLWSRRSVLLVIVGGHLVVVSPSLTPEITLISDALVALIDESQGSLLSFSPDLVLLLLGPLSPRGHVLEVNLPQLLFPLDVLPLLLFGDLPPHLGQHLGHVAIGQAGIGLAERRPLAIGVGQERRHGSLGGVGIGPSGLDLGFFAGGDLPWTFVHAFLHLVPLSIEAGLLVPLGAFVGLHRSPLL